MTYRLIHTNVDGSGEAGSFPSLEAAIAEADRLQEQADRRGNPYSYTYTVFPSGYNSRPVYRTKVLVTWNYLPPVHIGEDTCHLYGYTRHDKAGNVIETWVGMARHSEGWIEKRYPSVEAAHAAIGQQVA